MSTLKAARREPAPRDQQRLFDVGISDLADLREQKEALMTKAKAPNTLRAYKHAWKGFHDWCGMTGRNSLPVDPETIELFLTWGANERGYRKETLALALSAIQDKHLSAGYPSPLTASVRAVQAGIVRERREGFNGKDAVRVEHLRKICRRLSADDDPIHIRDRAIILVGFASAWRRCELSAMQVEHAKFEKQGARLWLPYSKGDQEGKGEETELVYAKDPKICPVRALKAWLKVRGLTPGPMFCSCNPLREILYQSISGQRIADIVKAELKRIGEDPNKYGAHSLRSGMITAAARRNVPLPAIMQHSRHKQVQTVIRYVRRELPFRRNVLARVL
ncbi:site-specific integrase [Nevskia soli]|uniref:site-specific integrase n=1 Tax=Nevskia soli TaxID=418856 RepID=UPI0015D8A166|nr:site-specific integrase [Nevskia soli]